MRPSILATCTILLRLVPPSYSFTLAPPLRRRNPATMSAVTVVIGLEDVSKGRLCMNELRIRRSELSAVNVEQENKVQPITVNSDNDSNNINNNSNDDSNNNIYEQLGIQEGQLALGVNPEEVYKYIGTRETLISKTLVDIPTLTREVAEQQVDQFLMDCEMVNMYIQYEKEVEKDPTFVVPDNDKDSDSNSWFTPRNIVAGYLGYVGVTGGPQMIRRYIAEQQVAGTWEPTHISLVDDWIDRTSTDAMARVLQRAADRAASVAVDAVTTATTVDTTAATAALPSTMTPDLVTDSLQSLVDTVTSVSQ